MAVWHLTVDFRDIWKDEGLSFRDLRDEVCRRLYQSEWENITEFPLQLASLFHDLGLAQDESEFVYHWGFLYDIADFDRVWLATVL